MEWIVEEIPGIFEQLHYALQDYTNYDNYRAGIRTRKKSGMNNTDGNNRGGLDAA
ncbi:hypothetical protein [Albidovulum aquaemixtae]|uniref:hypothetical protein n=1 Tax=Albidovulum aquaemixtae TaxID=1542388 RepID=UPI0015E80BD1|nr:hypothetical protein [Defluviimonas aquaemixtae]